MVFFELIVVTIDVVGNVVTNPVALQKELTNQLQLHENFGRGPGKAKILDMVTTYGVLGFGDVIHVLRQEGVFLEENIASQSGISDVKGLMRKIALPCRITLLPNRILEAEDGQKSFQVELGYIWGAEVVVGMEDRGQRLVDQNPLVMGEEDQEMDDSAYGTPDKRPRLGEPEKGFHYPVQKFMHEGGMEGLVGKMAERGLVVIHQSELVTKTDLLDMEERILAGVEEMINKCSEKSKDRYRFS